ncbi:hypothetical protein Tco_0807721 [Tanacetum coccineum]
MERYDVANMINFKARVKREDSVFLRTSRKLNNIVRKLKIEDWATYDGWNEPRAPYKFFFWIVNTSKFLSGNFNTSKLFSGNFRTESQKGRSATIVIPLHREKEIYRHRSKDKNN